MASRYCLRVIGRSLSSQYLTDIGYRMKFIFWTHPL
jgi:hypothetical protein